MNLTNYDIEIHKILLNQLNLYKTKKIIFWGASLFLEEFLHKYNLDEFNIIGIIDQDAKKQNTIFCGYKIYSNEYLKEIASACVIFTIKNNHDKNYHLVKNLIKNTNIELLPNIFQKYFSNLTQQHKDLTKNAPGFNYVYSTEKDLECFYRLEASIQDYSEMIAQDNLFLISLINQYKPQKILEVGVSKGASSLVILNSIQENAKLYSLDYNTEHYTLKGVKTGFLLDKYPSLKQKMELHTGGLSLKFMDKISSSIDDSQKFDFCLLDTAHAIPGEVLDFLQVLPYLKENAIVVLHDINLHLNRFETPNREIAYSSNVLFSTLKGKKFLPYFEPFESLFGNFFSNIGAVQLNHESFSNYFDIFNLLTHKWQYPVSNDDISECINFIKTHYGEYYSEYFKYLAQLQAIQN